MRANNYASVQRPPFHMSAINDLNLFVDKLLAEKGLADQEKSIYRELHADLLERLENIVNVTIVEKMPSDKLEAFEKLLDEKADNKTMRSFCEKHIPNVEEVIAATLLSFRLRYLGASA